MKKTVDNYSLMSILPEVMWSATMKSQNFDGAYVTYKINDVSI